MRASVLFSCLIAAPAASIAHSSPVALGCDATAYDLTFEDGSAIVTCPANCQASSAAAFGASIHPASSSVCVAALVDGLLPQFGGKIVVSSVPGIASYVATDGGLASSQAAADEKGPAFVMYALESIDQIASSLRLVDAAGTLASVGLLQVRTEAGFGTVCGVNAGAADVACRLMGFDHGAVGSSPCGSYGGADLCGALGTPVAMKSLSCTGGELDLAGCEWLPPSEECLSHEADAVIFCASGAAGGAPDGSLRLLSDDGAPSVQGKGRLEMFTAGAWGPVCSEGFAAGSAAVACKQMGYAGAAALSATSTCASAGGPNYCSSVAPRVSELACTGAESAAKDCPYEEGEDVYCAAEEAVVVSCAGDGDAQGRSPKAPAPEAELAAYAHKLELSCQSTLRSESLAVSPPGRSVIASCPGACGGQVFGSFVYAPPSSICAAAAHSGIIGDGGGDVVITVGYGQDFYFGSTRGAASSLDHGPERRSFTLGRPVPALLQRVSVAPASPDAGTSSFGT